MRSISTNSTSPEAVAIFNQPYKLGDAVNNFIEIPILPKKTDNYVSLFGAAWRPYYQVKSGEQLFEIPAFALGRGRTTRICINESIR